MRMIVQQTLRGIYGVNVTTTIGLTKFKKPPGFRDPAKVTGLLLSGGQQIDRVECRDDLAADDELSRDRRNPGAPRYSKDAAKTQRNRVLPSGIRAQPD